MKNLFLVLALICSSMLIAQKKVSNTVPKTVTKPKLVVGIVVDQMRWDYLFRFNHIFKSNGGFNRLMNEGFNCNNTFIPYTPTVTAAGHTCVYTGSVPGIHGITGNAWYDKDLNRIVYCSEDRSVEGVGGKDEVVGRMSPKNMLTTTITDELRMSSNFTSKVIGIALKDRGSILPAGHSANAAYWYDGKSGNFITSTYYMKALPPWVNEFNNRKLVDSLYALGWNTSLPKEQYLALATNDAKEYEAKPFGKEQTAFPYDFAKFIGKDFSKISTTPHGNTLTTEMAKAALLAEKMGKGNATDFLAISYSSPDYIGHSFGPNSWEIVDNYARLDIELGNLFDYLDKEVGKGQYTVFLTADHAVAHVAGFMKENKLPAGTIDEDAGMISVNKKLKEAFGADSLIVSSYNYQLTLNHASIKKNEIDKEKLVEWILAYFSKIEGIARVFEVDELMETPLNNTIKERIANGYFPSRSGDIQVIYKPGYMDGKSTGTTHGLWNPYDSHIPLLWYGWGIKKGSSHREVYMTDIAATVAALLKIQMPNGSIGKVIEEVLK
ncbi:MAG: alkaline phosphatase family protein [Chitinophagaceae bacterium]|nr:alkaline phosphatase family protein [Chitinophagaceae bacterium]